jgi:hypothetical protein
VSLRDSGKGLRSGRLEQPAVIIAKQTQTRENLRED